MQQHADTVSTVTWCVPRHEHFLGPELMHAFFTRVSAYLSAELILYILNKKTGERTPFTETEYYVVDLSINAQ